ncbi:MAG TPA: YhjD/YihY/BrkB family envelope integrity protein [Verrucomicrobiae bacterium]|jgi:membrane protein|nr:YhjD/YihY/BrkB family envelope integrity protein [Verrucomicrobiae bacterium]
MAKRSLSRLVRIATGEENEISLAGRLEHFIHFWFFVGKSFVQNRCLIRASALSYTTLLALIPLLAVAISVTSSLLRQQGEHEIYKAIDKFVSQVVPPATVAAEPPSSNHVNPDTFGTDTNAVVSPAAAADARVAAQRLVAQRIHEFIHNTRSGALGITGMALLIFVAISMLNSIEGTFNDIWGVGRGRHWLMRVTRFWMAITVGPLLIAVGLSLAGSAHFQATGTILQGMPVIGALILQTGTLCFIWLVFALLYRFIPNTKVQFSAALAGGIAGGTLWHLNNLFGFLYVSRVVGNSKIYGSLGLIPVFMAGLYLSWAILLFGAQIAYAFQNRKIYLQEKVSETVGQRDREILALRLMTAIGRRFQKGGPPAPLQELADQLEIPTKLTQQILNRLLAAHIITEISENAMFAPSRPLDSISAHDILLAMRHGLDELPPPGTPCAAEILGEFQKIENAENAEASRITLLTLVQQCGKE